VQSRPWTERFGYAFANTYYRFVMPLAGRRSIDFAPYGVLDYEVGSSFDELLERVRMFHPIVGVSDELPVAAELAARAPAVDDGS
jgi:hypothetical protein